FHEPRALHIDDDHVVQRRDLRSIADALRERLTRRGEVDGRARRAQYQLSAFFFHAKKRPTTRIAMKTVISTRPYQPRSRNSTAQGKRKITSTSKTTNSSANT